MNDLIELITDIIADKAIDTENFEITESNDSFTITFKKVNNELKKIKDYVNSIDDDIFISAIQVLRKTNSNCF